MKKWKRDKMQNLHTTQGDTMKVEIKDITRRVIYRNKINLSDLTALRRFLSVLENQFGIPLRRILKISEWI
jgi:hypothetical protein